MYKISAKFGKIFETCNFFQKNDIAVQNPTRYFRKKNVNLQNISNGIF